MYFLTCILSQIIQIMCIRCYIFHSLLQIQSPPSPPCPRTTSMGSPAPWLPISWANISFDKIGKEGENWNWLFLSSLLEEKNHYHLIVVTSLDQRPYVIPVKWLNPIAEFTQTSSNSCLLFRLRRYDGFTLVPILEFFSFSCH